MRTVPRIHLLDATLANQIAAGEVIERPAAVVKELVENALDAGATRVEIDLQDGGRRLVRVRDDGCGMGRADAELSVQRHATSKLRSKDDLFAIASYGFRGEALPSMAAVSRFTLLTCEPGALGGTRVEVEGGSVPRIADAGAPPGTTVEVRELFWNVPARRKFLKKAQTEQAQCLDAVLRLALPRTDVAFTVREGERTLLQLQAGAPGLLAARAEEALGREVRNHLVPFSGESRGVRAHGLAVSPAVEYGSARNVWLFANGRAIRDRSLTHAVLRAFGELMPHGRYPGAVVFLEVKPAELDVNVHPAKAEVRFADPRAAWEAINAGLSQVLARGEWMKPPAGPGAVEPARVYSLGEPAARVADAIERYGSRMPTTWWMPPASVHVPGTREATQPELVARPSWFRGLRYLGQLHRTYLVCEGPQGLVLVDQHAAHERINYQRLRGRKADAPVQPLLVPQVVQLPAAAAARVSESAALLASLGLEVDAFGGATAVVKALPEPLARLDERGLGALLTDLADELSAHGRGESLERIRDALLARAACHGSVRAHDTLAAPEAQALLDALDETDYGARCAHGRPVVAEWSEAEIERRFGRDYASHAHAAPPEAL